MAKLNPETLLVTYDRNENYHTREGVKSGFEIAAEAARDPGAVLAELDDHVDAYMAGYAGDPNAGRDADPNPPADFPSEEKCLTLAGWFTPLGFVAPGAVDAAFALAADLGTPRLPDGLDERLERLGLNHAEGAALAGAVGLALDEGTCPDGHFNELPESPAELAAFASELAAVDYQISRRLIRQLAERLFEETEDDVEAARAAIQAVADERDERALANAARFKAQAIC